MYSIITCPCKNCFQDFFLLRSLFFSFPLIFPENHLSCFFFPDLSLLHFWSASSSILSRVSSLSLSLSLIEDNKSWSWYRVRVLVVFHHQPFTALLCLNPIWLLTGNLFHHKFNLNFFLWAAIMVYWVKYLW